MDKTPVKKFDVHLFQVVRVKVEGVEAESIEEAIAKAEELAGDKVRKWCDGYLTIEGEHRITINDGEEVSHYLIDTYDGEEANLENGLWLMPTGTGEFAKSPGNATFTATYREAIEEALKCGTWQEAQAILSTVVNTKVETASEIQSKAAELVKLAEAKGIQPEDLDEQVHDLADLRAVVGSKINNGGLQDQFEFLLTGHDTIDLAYADLESWINER